MKCWLAAGCLTVCLAAGLSAAAKGPEVDLVNNKLSISADNIPLGRLLRLLDLATGMQSKVPPDLARRNVSVKFSDLPLQDGVRKIFQGQPFDYVVVEGRGVIVTAASQTTGAPESAAMNNGPQPPMQSFQQQPIEQPFNQELPPFGGAPQPFGGVAPAVGGVGQPGFPSPAQIPPPMQQQQPAMIQTPFGPIANPRAGQPVQPATPVPPQNPLFPGSAQPQTSPNVVGAQQAAPTPFGSPGPFGTQQPNPNNSNNTMFGSPTVFTAPGSTQPR